MFVGEMVGTFFRKDGRSQVLRGTLTIPNNYEKSDKEVRKKVQIMFETFLLLTPKPLFDNMKASEQEKVHLDCGICK
jgi:hypothetical protein